MQNSSMYSNSNERLCYLSAYVLFIILIKDHSFLFQNIHD